jgi:hypothetical protein
VSAPLKKRRPYAVSLPVETVEDRRLDMTARGVLATLIAKPNGWDVRADALARENDYDGRLRILSALRKLGAAGYYRLVRRQVFGAEAAALERRSGTWVTETEVSDVPVQEWADEAAERERVRLARREAKRRKHIQAVPPPKSREPHSGAPDSGQPESGHRDSLSSSLTVTPDGVTSTQRRPPQPPAPRGEHRCAEGHTRPVRDCCTDRAVRTRAAAERAEADRQAARRSLADVTASMPAPSPATNERGRAAVNAAVAALAARRSVPS